MNVSECAGEKAVQELWKRYFTSTAVRTRENRRLQQHFMPKKYWKYLPEKDPPEEL
jgi:probable DNA metabolism protein